MRRGGGDEKREGGTGRGDGLLSKRSEEGTRRAKLLLEIKRKREGLKTVKQSRGRVIYRGKTGRGRQ